MIMPTEQEVLATLKKMDELEARVAELEAERIIVDRQFDEQLAVRDRYRRALEKISAGVDLGNGIIMPIHYAAAVATAALKG